MPLQLIEGRAGSGYSDRLVFCGFEHAGSQARREEVMWAELQKDL